MTSTDHVVASGPARFEHWYDFAEGGPVYRAALAFPAPFEVARWSVAPGTANDLDVHQSREVWVVLSGTGTLTWADRTTVLRSGDVVAFDSEVPHQVRNDGAEPLRAVSVFWLPDTD